MANMPHEWRTAGGVRCCMNCVEPKRHIGCHSTCKEYKDAKAKHDEAKEKEKQAKEARGRVIIGAHAFDMMNSGLSKRTRKNHKQKRYSDRKW